MEKLKDREYVEGALKEDPSLFTDLPAEFKKMYFEFALSLNPELIKECFDDDSKIFPEAIDFYLKMEGKDVKFLVDQLKDREQLTTEVALKILEVDGLQFEKFPYKIKEDEELFKKATEITPHLLYMKPDYQKYQYSKFAVIFAGQIGYFDKEYYIIELVVDGKSSKSSKLSAGKDVKHSISQDTDFKEKYVTIKLWGSEEGQESLIGSITTSFIPQFIPHEDCKLFKEWSLDYVKDVKTFSSYYNVGKAFDVNDWSSIDLETPIKDLKSSVEDIKNVNPKEAKEEDYDSEFLSSKGVKTLEEYIEVAHKVDKTISQYQEKLQKFVDLGNQFKLDLEKAHQIFCNLNQGEKLMLGYDKEMYESYDPKEFWESFPFYTQTDDFVKDRENVLKMYKDSKYVELINELYDFDFGK